jgi:hypothetical protein
MENEVRGQEMPMLGSGPSFDPGVLQVKQRFG